MFCFRIGRHLLQLVWFGVLVGLLGCGPSAPGEVSGTITIKGAPPNIKGLQISFLAPDGRIVGAPVKEDGTYQAPAVPAGEAKIGFIFVPTGVEPTPKGKRRFPGKGDEAPATQEEPPNPIPQALRDGSTSNLTVQVMSGQKQVFDYDVK